MKASLSVAAGSILEAKPSGERELGLVLVDDPGEVGDGRGRKLGLGDQEPFQPDRVEVFLRDRGRGGQHAGRHRFLGNGRILPGDRLCRIDRIQGEAAAPGKLLVALVFHDVRGMRDLDHGAEARGEQSVEGRAGRGHLDPCRRVRGVREFENIAYQGDAALAVGDHSDFLLLQVRNGLDLLAAGADQQEQVMIENGERAGARRNPGVGAQNRQICLFAVELRERLCIVAVGHDLEPQPRGIILQHRRQPGGEARFGAIGLADGKHQRLGIAQPGPAAPHHDGGQDQGQDGKQQDLGPIALDDPRTATRHFRMRRWGFSTHGSYPRGQGRVAAEQAAGRPKEFVNA